MENEIIYKAIDINERVPDGVKESGPKVVVGLFDGRLPLVVMYTGFPGKDAWRYLGDQKPIEKGLTHWLERQK